MTITVGDLRLLADAWGHRMKLIGIQFEDISGFDGRDPASPVKADEDAADAVKVLRVSVDGEGGVLVDGSEALGGSELLTLCHDPFNKAFVVGVANPRDEDIEVPMDGHDPGDGLRLMRMGRVRGAKWLNSFHGHPVLTSLDVEGHAFEVENPNRMENVGTPVNRPDDPDLAAAELLARLGATVLSRHPRLDGPDSKVEFTFDEHGHYHPDALVESHPDMFRVNVEMKHADFEFYGQNRRNMPDYKPPLEIAQAHGFDGAVVTDSSMALPSSPGRTAEEVIDLMGALGDAGWDASLGHPTQVELDDVTFALRWKGVRWAHIPRGSIRETADGLRFGDAISSLTMDQAIQAAGMDGILMHTTRSAKDGRVLVLYDAGRGWRHDLGMAMDAGELERPGMIR